MNEEQIKQALISKYEKDLRIIDDNISALHRSSLENIAQMISIVFDSRSEATPDDVLTYLNTSNIEQNESDSDVTYQETDYEKAIRESKEEYKSQNNANQSNQQAFTLEQLPAFNLDNIRYLFTDDEVAAERKMTIDELKNYRKQLVHNLIDYDSINGARYKEKIIEQSKKSATEIKDGIFIAILLHTGDRISKLFSIEENGSVVYYWVASNEKMIKDKIKPRHFVIVKNIGKEINPDTAIGEQISDKQILLNVRLI